MLLLLVMLAAPAQQGDAAPDLPVSFRCDGLEATTSPNRQVCRGHVVVRRGDLLLCCDALEGQFDADWACQRVLCRGDVRARRGEEALWADAAELAVDSLQLALTGRPQLRRGGNTLRGSRIDVDLRGNAARVRGPTGVLVTPPAAPAGREAGAVAVAPAWPDGAALPDRCPLPGAER